MKWLRLLVLLVVVVTLVAVVALRQTLLDLAAEALRGLAEREGSAALDAPLTIGALRLTLVPPGIEADAIGLGADGSVGQVAHLSAQLRSRTSLRQGRPVLDVTIDAARLDLPALLHALPPPVDDEPVLLPAFRLRRVQVRDAQVQLTPDPDAVHVTSPEVSGQVSVGSNGRLRFAGRAVTPQLRRGERALTLAEAEARGGETIRGWRLSGLMLRGEGLDLRGTPRGDALGLDGHLELSRLAVVDDQLAELRGTATLSGTLEGPLDAAIVNASVQVPGLAVGERALGDVAATATVDAKQLTLTSARLRGLGGEVEASGALHFDSPLSYQGRARWTGVDSRQAAALIPADLPRFAANGAVDLSGALDPLRVEARGDGRVTPPAGAPITWKGSGSYAPAAAQVDVEIAQGAGNRAAVQAQVDGGERLSGSVRLDVSDPDGLRGVLPIASLPNVRGNATAAARLDGTLSEPRLTGDLSARNLTLSELRVDRAGGRFTLDRHRLRTEGITLALGGGEATLRGAIALDTTTDNAWSVRAARIDGGLVTLLGRAAGGVDLPIAGGTLSADASANGPWPRVRLDGTAALERFWVGREHVERAAATVRATAGRWTADATISNRPGQRLTAHGEGALDGALALNADGQWTLTALQRGEKAEMGGTIYVAAAVRGRPPLLDGTASIRAEDLVLAGRPIGAVQVTAEATRGRWHANAVLLDGAFTAQADVRPDAGMPFTFDGAWRDADLARLIGPGVEAHLESSGTIQARGRLADLRQAEITVEVPLLRLVQGERTIGAQAPVRITCRRGTCTLAPITWSGGGGSLQASGELSFDGRLRLVMNGAGSLGVLELIGEPIESATGQFTVDAVITNGAGGVRATGTLSLERAGIDAGLPVAVTRATGRLSLDGTTVRVDELTGRVGTGTFRVGGGIDLVHGPNLTWELIDVGAVPLPSLEMEASGTGTVDGSWDAPRLAGDIHIHRMLYDRDINLTDFLPSLNRALARAPRAPGEREVSIDLHIVAPAQLFVENNLARIEGRADLRVTGTANHPVLAGRVEALDGQINFRSREFEILSATLDFRPDLGLVAALNVSAEAVIDTPDATYTVGVRVTGTSENPRIALTSDDPSLTQTDIATLIAVGKTTGQLRTAGGGGFSAWDALGFVPRELTAGVEGQAKQFLPIDRIEFESVYSRTTGAFEPQIKIGKDLTDHLAVSVGQTFGVSSRTSVEAEYRLGPRVSIPLLWESQTETEAGAFGAGVRVRYEFWRLTPFTLLGGR